MMPLPLSPVIRLQPFSRLFPQSLMFQSIYYFEYFTEIIMQLHLRGVRVNFLPVSIHTVNQIPVSLYTLALELLTKQVQGKWLN